MSVVVVNPPFTSSKFPSHQSSLALAALKKSGVEATYLDLNAQLAALWGEDLFSRVAETQRVTGIAEYVGSALLRRQYAFDEKAIAMRQATTFADLVGDIGFAEGELDQLADSCLSFQEAALDAAELDDVELILLSCNHQQLAFSLSTATALKARAGPPRAMLFGTYFDDAEAAHAVVRAFPDLDGVIYADTASLIIESFRKLFEDAPLAGLATRHPGSLDAVAHLPASGLSVAPDYGTCFEDLLVDPIQTVLPWRTSIGCKWAEKSHCTFCGLVPTTMDYGRKKGAATLAELTELVAASTALDVVASDLLFEEGETLDALIDFSSTYDSTFFFEVRPTTSKLSLGKMSKAHIWEVQAGLESFDDCQLQAMGKGTTSLLNVRFLKWCAEFGISVSWIYLYGFSGETRESLASQRRLIRALRHLAPPIDITRVRIERGSPMSRNPKAFGFVNVRPAEAVLHCIPAPLSELCRFTKYFEHNQADGSDPNADAAELVQEVRDWQENWALDQVFYRVGPGFVKIVNLSDAALVHTLDGWQMEVFLMLDDVKSLRQLDGKLARNGHATSRDDLATFLSELRDLGYAVEVRDKWISTVPRARTRDHGVRHMQTRQGLFANRVLRAEVG